MQRFDFTARLSRSSLLVPALDVLHRGLLASWLDALHQDTAIAQRAVPRIAPNVAAAEAATGRPRLIRQPIPRPIPCREAPGAAGAVSAGPAVVESRVGREQVRPWCTRLPR